MAILNTGSARTSRSAILAAAVAVVAIAGTRPAMAVTYVKANNASNLTTAASYVANSGSPTSAADFVQFDANYAGVAIGNTGAITLGGFIVTDPTANVSFGFSNNSTETVGNGAISGDQKLIDMSAATRDVSINNGTAFFRLTGGPGSNMIFDVAANRTLTLFTKISAQGNNKTLRLDGAGTINLSGAIAPATTGFNVNGPTVNLNAANTFTLGTGAFTVTSGQLNLVNAGALGGVPTAVLNGGVTRIDSGLVGATTTFNVNAANALTFGTGVTAASVAALTGSTSGSFNLTNADVNGVALTVGSGGGGGTYSGTIGGAGSLTKTGAGTQVLAVGGQSYAGATNVSGGTLQTNVAGNTSTGTFGAGAINLSGGGTVRFNATGGNNVNSALDVGTGGGTLSFRGNATFSPTAVTGNGTLGLVVDNTITVTPSTFGGFAGTVNVTTTGAAATLRLGGTFDNASLANASLSLGTGIALTRNAGTNSTVTTNIGTLNGVAGSTLGGSLVGNGTFTFSVGARNEASAFAGAIVDGSTKTALAKVGNADLTLSGNNTYTGNTTVTGGSLTLASTGQLKFLIGASGVNNKLTGTGTVALDGTFLFDLTNATANATDVWNIVDVPLTESYGTTFAIAGFANNNDGTFSNGTYLFTESTGDLTVVATPEPTTIAALGLTGLLFKRRRRA